MNVLSLTSPGDRLMNERRIYRELLDRCEPKFSESAVHDLRVEPRRLLAMLDLLCASCSHAPEGPQGV